MHEILRQFNENGIRYILIGGQAIRLLGLPRFSMDWDFFVPPRDQSNFDRINDLLESELDAPLVPLGPKGEGFIQTYQTLHGIMQFHLVLPGVPGFDQAERSSIVRLDDHGIAVRCMSPADLLRTKEASNRPQDALDIAFLRELTKTV